jgi:hypothetical protein
MNSALVLDIETFSSVILADTSTTAYAMHATTGVWCAALALNDLPIHVWYPGAELPRFLREAIEDPACLIIGHNANFEIAHWRHILAPRHNWPPLPPLERWRCTMAGAQALALPPSLGKCADALQFTHRKGDDRLMKQMARPRQPRSGEDPALLYFDDDPEHLRQLSDYCAKDVLCEQELFLWLLRHWDQQASSNGSMSKPATDAA